MAALVLAAGCARSEAGFEQSAAETYCVSQGGSVVQRTATYNTSADPTRWVPLAGRLTLCEFDGEEPASNERVRLAVDLRSLYATAPTLAALAYLARLPPFPASDSGLDAADADCVYGLGGSTRFGSTTMSGGWVADSEPAFRVMRLCVFADTSAIDVVSLFNYARGVIGGIDLATKLRYRLDQLTPAPFGSNADGSD